MGFSRLTLTKPVIAAVQGFAVAGNSPFFETLSSMIVTPSLLQALLRAVLVSMSSIILTLIVALNRWP